MALLAVLGSVSRKAARRSFALGVGYRTCEDSSLRFVQDDRSTFWSFAKFGFDEMSSIFGTWHVTNVSAANVWLLRFCIQGYSRTIT